MTVEEFYRETGGDYADAKKRFRSDDLIKRFVISFPNDKSFSELKGAIAANDRATAFRAAHTLKGVALNLSFTHLQDMASDLTEQLRPQTEDADPELVSKVEEAYINVIAGIENLK